MQTIYFQTHGCSSNQSESEVMAGILDKAGYHITEKPETADLIVVNTCTVKGEGTAARSVRKLREQFPEKKMIVSGCVTKELIPLIRQYAKDASIINTHNLQRILEVVEETLNGNIVEFLKQENIKKINFPRIRKNPVIGIVPILVGCANFCTFCSTKLIKNKLYSYEIEDIKEEIKTAVQQGCKEIWLTSEDNGAYQMEKGKGSKLPELLTAISDMKGDFKVRLGMMNPGNLLPVLDNLVKAFNHKRFYQFIHVPIQSGNNEILKKMNRQYQVRDFFKVISKFKKAMPDITIATDIIIGFPEETEKQFQDSINAIKKLNAEVVNISKFQSRKGTVAYKMASVKGNAIKERSKQMTDVFRTLVEEKNKRWLGWQGPVFLNEVGKNSTMQGRNYAYRPIVVIGSFPLGTTVNVEIDETTIFDIRGKIVEKITVNNPISPTRNSH